MAETLKGNGFNEHISYIFDYAKLHSEEILKEEKLLDAYIPDKHFTYKKDTYIMHTKTGIVRIKDPVEVVKIEGVNNTSIKFILTRKQPYYFIYFQSDVVDFIEVKREIVDIRPIILKKLKEIESEE